MALLVRFSQGSFAASADNMSRRGGGGGTRLLSYRRRCVRFSESMGFLPALTELDVHRAWRDSASPQ